MKIPDLNSLCGRRLTYRNLVECGNTWIKRATGGSPIDNVPKQVATYAALFALCGDLLDPLADALGPPVLTYGFASSALTAMIAKGIAPRLDQHASHEVQRGGSLICQRGGAAVDLIIPGRKATEVARWIVSNTNFDRIYLYDDDRPLHVSHGPETSRLVYQVSLTKSGRRMPRQLKLGVLG
jgi:hypothetical protein